jgi:hypothetical protein
MVIDGDPVAITQANSALLVELLGLMERETRLVIIERAVEGLEKAGKPNFPTAIEAIQILRTQFARIS